MKRVVELIAEKILMVSGGLTSVTIILIVFFLFKEGIGLFGSPTVEQGYVVAVNRENTVRNLSPVQLKEIFDSEVTNWSQYGGADEPIVVFRIDDIDQYVSYEELGDELQFIPQCLSKIIADHPGMIAFFPDTYLAEDFAGRIIDKRNITPGEFFLGDEWFPTATPAPLFGIVPLVMGTLWVSLAAILFALPLGMAVAIYMAELANDKVRKVLKPVIELLAGIPSVVYGFFGLVVIVPLIQQLFGLPVGETALAGSVILAIMALPTIITVAEDSIRNVPRAVKEASLALGATQWQTIRRVVLPYSVSGIMAAVVLGIGRAIGETMAVLMVTGNSAIIPHGLLEPVRTIPATIAAELGEAPNGGVHYEALFLLGCILFVITLIISITAEMMAAKKPKQQI
ncbi:MAG TPA: phosphate ABC transporter permease subunit PstC [Candidatus Rikenella faecigallinarum]|uniref:Phosphate transport system permease protein n=1 Tax=Candidatus Rikenella faecigallinarum TaxID=2838745 RepID=A0A9D1QCQ8_9BACT|nr:phosphate ABC transporter permease subunit PstC [Candidatus Rikenella faecigallinarum]